MRSVRLRAAMVAIAAVVGVLAGVPPAPATAAPQGPPPGPVPGHLPATKANAAGSKADQVVVSLAPGSDAQGRAAALARSVGATVTRVRTPDQGRASAVLRVPAGRAPAVAARLAGDHRVAWAEPDRILRAATEPNDPCYVGVSQCTNVGVNQDNLKVMHAAAAWSVTRGDPGLRVAVLDTAVDTSHPDLAGKVDLAPPDFLSNNPLLCLTSPDAAHGTHVTGILAASTNNAVEIAGLGWDTRVLSVRVLDDCGNGYSSDIADGINYAVNVGARIINLSLAGGQTQDVGQAVAYAVARGVVVVAAAGNEATNAPQYPAAFPGVLGIGASTNSDQIASFSNFGNWVPLAAPGQGIWSTVPGGGLAAADGTSASVPHVSAVAALLMAAAPDITGPEVDQALEGTAVPIPGTGSLVVFGRVDAGAALASLAHRVRQGYRLAASDGGVFAFGAGGFFGSAGGTPLNRPVVGAAGTPTQNGYWLVASDGGIFSYGDAGFYGSTGGRPLNQPVVGMAPTPTGKGYWLVASDGGIFTFGDAGFYGSTGGRPLNRPIVGMAATPTGKGYWLVASDGGIFTFGDAGFRGSTGGQRLNQPIVAMAPAKGGQGYWLVASDGGIFTFGSAGFFGSTGGLRLNRPVVAMKPTPSGAGYWLVASDGGIFAFGDARFLGSTGSLRLNSPIVSVA